jgi:hypothetical protein
MKTNALILGTMFWLGTMLMASCERQLVDTTAYTAETDTEDSGDESSNTASEDADTSDEADAEGTDDESADEDSSCDADCDSGRLYTLAPNYNNDYCFLTAVDEVTFLTCSLLALRTVEVGEEYFSGRETIGQITEKNSQELTDAGLMDAAYSAFANEDEFFDELFSRREEIRTVMMGDGGRDFVESYLQNQLNEFCRYSQGEGPETDSDIGRYYALIPNYSNDDCFTDLTNETEFLACSILSASTFYSSNEDLYLSGREAMGLILDSETASLSDFGIYDQALQTFADETELLDEISEFDLVIYDGTHKTSHEFFSAQLSDFADYR